jgi:predicted transcriptional regulator
MSLNEAQYFNPQKYRRKLLNKVTEEIVLINSDVQTVWDRRDRLHIMAEILETTQESQLKTRIMYSANLSFSQLNEYLSFLTEKGFLRAHLENGKKFYEATDKGSRYIEQYWEILNLLNQREPVEAEVLVR